VNLDQNHGSPRLLTLGGNVISEGPRRLSTINTFIATVIAHERHSARGRSIAVVRFDPDIRSDFGHLSYPASIGAESGLILYSLSAEQFAAAVRRRHPAFASWASTTRHPRPGRLLWFEEIYLDLGAMPSGERLAQVLRASKTMRRWLPRVA
jgi:hypothetical protein